MTFVEDQIEHLQGALEPSGQLGPSRYLIRDRLVADLRFRADDALPDGRRRHEIRARDLLGRQPAHFAQGQGDARVGLEGGVAAGEDQAQLVVFDMLGELRHRRPFRQGGELEAALPPLCAERRQRSMRLETPGRDEPAVRVRGNAVLGPSLGRGSESFVHRLFGLVKVAEQANQRGQDASPFAAVQPP